jgi:outer membrane receptor protein involved in Fe transport
MRKLCGSVLVAGMTLFSPATGWGQVTTATIYGTVIDASGARIPGASVSITQQETGAVTAKVTTETGEFQFDFVRVGTYTIAIELPGFKRYQATGIALVAGQSVRQTYTLEVGLPTETVEVEAAAPLVNTVSAEQQQTFSTQTVRELPLARRNFTGILSIGAGVTIAGGGSSEGVRMNGIGRSGTGFAVDGTDANGNPESRGAQTYNGANYVDVLSLESIAEVNTVKGVLPAEYGGVLGGQVNILTRSGTNEYHGSLFENFQAENLNAKDPFLTTKPPFTYNQFGGSFGGPIKKNRIFIFGAYEGYRESRSRRVESNVLTPFHRDTILRAVPSYRTTLQVLPLPNQPHDPQANTGLFIGVGKDARRDNHLDLKGDLRLTNNSNFALTYTRGRPFAELAGISSFVNPEWGQFLTVKSERGTVSYVTGGPSWTSETRYGYNQNDSTDLWGLFTVFDPVNSTEKMLYGRRIGRMTTNLGWNSGNQNEIYILTGRIWSLSEKFSKHLNKHSLKFGAQYTHHCCRQDNPEGVEWGYTGLPDLLNNIPSRVNISFGNGDYTGKMWELGLFVQDDWRIHPRLTLNLGLRYDYFSHMVATERNNSGSFMVNLDGLRDSQFNVGPLRPASNPYESDGVNFGPRFGFSYDVDGKSKTVVRGGMGVLFSPFVMAPLWQSVHTQYAPKRIIFSRQDAIRYGFKYPMYNDDFRPIVERLIKDEGSTIAYAVINPQIQNPYTMHYTLGIQRELTSNLALETSFVGVLGRKFVFYRVPNEPDRNTGFRPNPKLQLNYYIDESQTSSYVSWQSSLRKRYSRNLSGSVHYTWGKTLGTGGADIGAWYQGDNNTRVQNFFNVKVEKGPTVGDMTHYFASELLYEIPMLASLGNAVARQALANWQLGGIFKAESGQPLGITQATSLNHQRPDYVLGTNSIEADWRTTGQYLNRNAFAQVPVIAASGAASRPGTLGWGAARGPGAWNLDLSLAKNFTIEERIRLQIRTDLFNALNHVNLTNVSTSINSATFGQLRSTRGQRVIQLNGRLSW